MKMYQVFTRKNKKGARWHEYSGIFESKEEAADCALLAADCKLETINGYSMAYEVREIETEKAASRPAECVNMTEIQAEVYEQVYRHSGDENAVREIIGKYGAG